MPYAAHACLAAAVLLLPVAMWYWAPDAIMLPKLTLIWVAVIAAAALVVVSMIEGRRPPLRSPLVLAVVGFVTALVITTATSQHRAASIMGIQRRYGGLVPQVLYAGAMVVVYAVYRGRDHLLRQVAWACLAGSSVMSGYLLVQAAGWDWAEWVVNGAVPEFPGSTLGNSNFAGGYLAIAIPLSLYVLATTPGRRTRVLVGLLCAVELLALWCTRSRGGMLALLAAALTTVLLARRWLPRWAKWSAAAVAVLAASCALLVVWHPGTTTPPGPLDRVRTSTLENRVNYWRSGWEMFRQHPLHGLGPDNYYAFYGRFERPEQAPKEALATVEEPHNVFVERAAATGILGLGTYLLVVILVVGNALAVLRRPSSGPPLLTLVFLAAFVAYVVQGFFSIDVPPLAFMGWLALGAMASLGASAQAPPGSDHLAVTARPARRTVARPLAQGAAVTGAVVLTFLGLRPLRATLEASKGRFVEATELAPWEAANWLYAGEQAESRAASAINRTEQVGHLREADSFYREALRRRPDDLRLFVQLAILHARWAEAQDPSHLRTAELWWRRARAVKPLDPEVQRHHAAAKERADAS